MKFKKAALLLLSVFVMPVFSSCSAVNYSAEEIYGARAAYTISRHIGNAASFVITYAEYSDDGINRTVTADCALYYSGSEYERYIFLVGEGEYFREKTAEQKGVFDEETGLYMLNRGDTILNKDESKKLNEKNILKIFNEFLTSGDKTILGID